MLQCLAKKLNTTKNQVPEDSFCCFGEKGSWVKIPRGPAAVKKKPLLYEVFEYIQAGAPNISGKRKPRTIEEFRNLMDNEK